jgi:uncharacterized protein (TIGR02453 family)
VSAPAPTFDRETLRFLANLAANNNRDWFEANKQRYEDHFLTPALAFVDAMRPAITKISSHFRAVSRRMGGSIMRIHRDTRFARDKSPYKTNIGIQFRHARARDVHAPGFYVHIEPGRCFLGAGIWHPEPGARAAIRTEIVQHPDLWQRVRDARAFRQCFDLGGEQLARMPRGFPADAPHADDLRRQDFIGGCNLPDEEVVRGNFADSVAGRFASAAPFVAFLCGALDLEF